MRGLLQFDRARNLENVDQAEIDLGNETVQPERHCLGANHREGAFGNFLLPR